MFFVEIYYYKFNKEHTTRNTEIIHYFPLATCHLLQVTHYFLQASSHPLFYNARFTVNFR